MKKIIFGVLAGALTLGGCSSYGTSCGVTKNGEVRTITVQYKGKPLTCINMNPGLNSEVLSCEFIDYYNNDNTLEGQPR